METVTKQRQDINQGNAIAWQNKRKKQYNQETESKQRKTNKTITLTKRRETEISVRGALLCR